MTDFERIVAIFQSDSMDNRAGFLVHVDFVDEVDGRITDLVFDRETFQGEKKAFREAFLKTVSVPWFRNGI